jgi:hypothetical protein
MDTERSREIEHADCRGCGRDELAFALADGLCYWCTGALPTEGSR